MLMMVLCKVISEAHSSESFDGQTFYFGELHGHTGISPDGGSSDDGFPCTDADPLDGIAPPCGSLADVFDAARDTYHLDFVSFTDHTFTATDPDLFYDFLQRGLDETSSTFVVIPGAERALRWAATGDVGHKTNLVFQDDVDVLATLDLTDFGGESYGQTKTFSTCDDVWAHPAAMAAEFGPTLEFAHHPAQTLPMATDWTCHDQTYEPVVEVYGGFGNSLRLDDYDKVTDPDPDKMVHEALETYGLRVGFVGGTDKHDTRPGAVCAIDTSGAPAPGAVGRRIYGGGLTIVTLPDGGEFKRSTIYGELVERRSLVTTGPEMPVSVHWITPDNTSHAIGEELTFHRSADESATLSVKIPTSSDSATDWDSFVVAVRAVGYATTFELTEQVEGEWSIAIPNDQLPTWLYAEVEIDGAAYYGGPGACADSYPVDADGNVDLEFGIVDDREFVWSSPVWFDSGTDIDGDAYAYDVDDCDDYDAEISPEADEVWYDGVDQNCDGNDVDQDWDGFAYGVDDCDDEDAARYPGAPEIPDNGIDEDCDGVDSELASDLDGDGYTDETGDCDDDDAAINPDAEEVWYDGVDQNCDGNDLDQDWDGFDYVDDCDDDDWAISPDAEEVWYDGVDQNCDGNDLDQDWDGFDSVDDCDDLDDARYPGALEILHNGIDEDCNGVDSDADGDGYVSPADCDDANARIHPGARDIPLNGIDEDCNGSDGRRRPRTR